ncbi:ankyrin repeat domain-containing protein [Niabella aurantiaca]|uniref:ankyrin repeat domain-containing protein n=1 Tax=Niabella aurantiaca TaxID=379900 RepID=UPI0003646146|nr:ankyrin repeat domain-containing protein [Niabella aurantiaca]
MTKATDLFGLIDKNNTEGLTEALRRKTDIEMTNPEGQTPLLYALYKKDRPSALLLIGYGADVNARDQVHYTPFLYAGAQGFTDVVKACLQHGADFNIFNRYGRTALMPACEKAYLETVRLLAQTPGFPIDHVNDTGWTALLEAILLGEGDETHASVAAELIAAGCNTRIPDKKGITPLVHARELGYHKIASLLEAAGARPEAQPF